MKFFILVLVFYLFPRYFYQFFSLFIIIIFLKKLAMRKIQFFIRINSEVVPSWYKQRFFFIRKICFFQQQKVRALFRLSSECVWWAHHKKKPFSEIKCKQKYFVFQFQSIYNEKYSYLAKLFCFYLRLAWKIYVEHFLSYILFKHT